MRSDTELLLWAVAHAGNHAVQRLQRWAHVMDMFCVGSTSAHELCRRAGVDPDEQVGGCLCPLEADELPCPVHPEGVV